jgi:PAS domain S-box-containing protein
MNNSSSLKDSIDLVELQAIQDKFQNISAAAQDAIIIMDNTGNISHWNKAAERIFGYSEEEIINKPLHEIIAPKRFFNNFHEKFTIFKKTGHGPAIRKTLELAAIRKDNIEFPIELSLSSVKINDKWNAIGILRDITERKQMEEALEHRVELKLITDISTSLINLPLDEIDIVIKNALKCIGEFNGVDRSYVLLFSDKKNKMNITHEWCAKGIEPQISNMKGLDTLDFPWIMGKLNRSEIIHIPIVTELPLEASFEKEILQSQNIRSLIIIPMVYNGTPIGYLGLNSITEEKVWSKESIMILNIVSEIFVNALERRRTEEVIRKSELRFRHIVENMSDWIWEIDANGVYTYCSKNVKEVLGYAANEMIGKTPFDIMHTDKREKTSALFAAIIKEKENIRNLENWIYTKNGQLVCMSSNGIPVLDDTGELIGYRGVNSDITQRKNIKKSLENSEKKFFTMFDNNPMGAVIIDSNRMIKEVNSVAADMIGRSKPDILGKICHEFICPKAPNNCPIFDHGMDVNCVETTLLKKDYGETPIEKTVAMVDIDGKILLLEMFYDISERQQMQRDLINQRDTLKIKAQELAAASKTKSEFLANMSHELRTPLNSIIGFSEILHDQTFGPANEKQMRYLENVLTSSKHLLTLINDILDLSKVEAGKMDIIYEDFTVSSVINEVKTLVVSIASKKNIIIDVNVDEKLTTIHADVAKFKQILFNLMSNAIKFSANGGSVTINARRINDMAQVSITDTGMGISKKDQKKLFQPFMQADASASRQFEGTGLGLALTKRFVEMHGGKVWIESELNRGSTFTFTIPVQPETGIRGNNSSGNNKEYNPR